MKTLAKPTFALMLFTGIVWLTAPQIDQTQQTTKGTQAFVENKESKRYDQPDKATAWLQQRWSTPKGTNAATLNHQLKQQIESRVKSRQAAPSIPAFSFEDIGPGVFGGRIRAFAIHPEQEGVLLAGGVSGGMWKSTDDGASWQAMSDFLPNIMIGSMTTDPDNPNRVFVGTGEGFFNFDAAQGAGIYVSEDFGETWDVLTNTLNDNFYYVNRLARIPNSDVLLAATRKGIFRSANLGQSWSEASGHFAQGRGFVDLKLNPSDSDHLLAVHYGLGNDSLMLEITTPSTIAGFYDAVPATFGPTFSEAGINEQIVLVDDNSGFSDDGCQAITNDVTGKIALIQRGGCNFTVKVVNAQDAGALAVLIFQNSSDEPFAMGGEDDSITIPSAMISQAAGDSIKTASNVSGIIRPVVADPLGRFVMESNDAGSSWTVLDNQGLPAVNLGRMELGFGSDGVVYVAAADAEDATLGLWRSPGQGQLFTKTASNTPFVERQGWYDLAIAVNPSNSSEVVLGAVDQFITHDGGASISKNTFWNPNLGQIPNYVHADHHGYFYSPHQEDHLYVVSDGGVAKSEDGGLTYFSLNNGLNISQSYGIAVSPDGSRVTSGTQDNGSQMYYGNSSDWFEWQGGDGGFSGWDQQQGNFVYGSYVEGQMYGSNNQGLSAQAMELPDTDGASFIQPFVLDENDGNRMMVGTDNVFLTTNARSLGGASWTDISDTLDGSSISALAFNPNNVNQAFAGTNAGHIYRINTLTNNSSVTRITPDSASGSDFNLAPITDLKVSADNRLYATAAGYTHTRLISTDADGNIWRNESSGLPNMPLHQVTFDPQNPDQLFVGSELGLWASTDSGWERYSYDVAYTRVIDLVWHGDNTLFVGTHGRGTFKATRNPFTVSFDKFITTNSSCDDDNILDGGESGTVLVQVKNNTGLNLDNVLASWNVPSGLTLSTSNHSLGTLPAHSEAMVPINVTMDSSNSCLSDIDFDITLSYDGGQSSHDITLLSGANQAVKANGFSANAEGNTMMSAELMLGNSNWQIDSDAFEGSQSWFASDEPQFSDKTLTSPWLTAKTGDNVLTFALKYIMEGDASQYWDGAVLELRTMGSPWKDIGHLSSVAYDGHLFTNNSIQGRKAWSGAQPNWRQASVNLGTDYAGKQIQFRFRVVSDTNTAAIGFWVDDIEMSNVYATATAQCDTCISQGTNQARPNKGLWYDPSRNGHGFVVETTNAQNTYYIMFYTYDNNGVNEWYNTAAGVTLSNGILNEGFAANTLYRPTWDWQNNVVTLDNNINDGRLRINFNSDQAAAHPACQDGFPNRWLAEAALATWRINNTEATWCIEPVVQEKNKPSRDFGGTWWGGLSENGWGFSIAQSFDTVTSIIYYYDADGSPRWTIGTEGGHVPGQELTIPLLEVSGFGRMEDTIPFTTANAGSLKLQLFNTLQDEGVDGIGDLELEFLGAAGGRWDRNDLPITIFTAPHK